MGTWERYVSRNSWRESKDRLTITPNGIMTIHEDILGALGIAATCDLHIGVGESAGLFAVSAGDSRKLTQQKRSHRMALRVHGILTEMGYSSANNPARHPHYTTEDGKLVVDPRREHTPGLTG